MNTKRLLWVGHDRKEAIDTIRLQEIRSRAAAGLDLLLKKMCRAFLKTRRNWTTSQRARMRQIEDSALRTLKAFLLVKAFQHFWIYRSPTWAGKFLDAWCAKVARSRLDPLKRLPAPSKPTTTSCSTTSRPKNASQTVASMASTPESTSPVQRQLKMVVDDN